MTNATLVIEKERRGFQTFSLYPGTSSVMVSNRLIHEIDCRIVQKYLPIQFFIPSIKERYFYQAAPSRWEDVFELKYLDILDSPNNGIPSEDLPQLKDMSIFCACMTYNDTDNEEASWKSYNTERDKVIRVSYDFGKLCTILDKSIDNTIYIGLVDYKPRKEILNPMRVDCNNNERDRKDLKVLYVNNFCLKQDAYSYEKELRFCTILTGQPGRASDEYKIMNVDVSPSIKRITLPPINYTKKSPEESTTRRKEQFLMYKRLKEICPNVPIHVSNLYDSSKVEMTSEI